MYYVDIVLGKKLEVIDKQNSEIKIKQLLEDHDDRFKKIWFYRQL